MNAFGIFSASIMALLVGLICAAVYQDHEHTVFLEQHGCQLLTRAPTGRQRLVGKLLEDEYVYECKDGDRTEIGT
jgi:hypothetical protein